MDRQRALRWTAVAVVCLSLLASGPAVGVLEPTRDRPATVGTGNATAADVRPSGGVALERGRFGTGVLYLRIPEVRVAVASVTGHPQLRYTVDAPGLSVRESVTRVIDDPGIHRLALSDRAMPPDSVSAGEHRVTLTVRVQSFDGDRTVFERTARVGVSR